MNNASKSRPLPVLLRIISWMVIWTQVYIPYAPFANAEGSARRSVTASADSTAPVSVHQEQPRSSGYPTDDDLFNAPGLIEPLVPSQKPSTIEENRSLMLAIERLRKRTSRDDVTALSEFLEQHPHTTWRIAVLVNIGLTYRYSGHFSKALDVFEELWANGKRESAPNARILVDLAAGELAELNARLGRYDRLQRLLPELRDRGLRGRGTESLAGAEEGAWTMKNMPQQAYRCGPFAVGWLYRHANKVPQFPNEVENATSSPSGTSLAEVYALARKVKLDYRIARRDAGAEVIIPAVIHWKSGHFAALLERQNEDFRLEDPTFGGSLMITAAALEEEASSYFLIPNRPLPRGWHEVSFEDASEVWGKGTSASGDKRETRPGDIKLAGDCPKKGMASYSFHALLVSLNIVDTPLAFTPPRGPSLDVTLTYNHREAGGTPNPNFSNVGLKWNLNLITHISDWEPENFTWARYHTSGGGYEDYSHIGILQECPPNEVEYSNKNKTRGRLLRKIATRRPGINDTGYNYELTFPDGAKEIFDRSNDTWCQESLRRFFRTKSLDRFGNELTYSYDSGLRLTTAQNQLGHSLTLEYGLSADPKKITKVTVNTGQASRSATFQYTTDGKLLARIIDTAGLVSEFGYDGTSDFINSLTTPYGTTRFSRDPRPDRPEDKDPPQTETRENLADRWLTATDPLGQKEVVVYSIAIGSIPDASHPTPSAFDMPLATEEDEGRASARDLLPKRNTFYWDKRACEEIGQFNYGSPDYFRAQNLHWLRRLDNPAVAAGIPERQRAPLENRIWYRYATQPGPTDEPGNGIALPAEIHRILDDGSVQTYKYEYNDLGLVTKSTDPLSRITSFIYNPAPNDMELVEIRNMTLVGPEQQQVPANELLGRFTYYNGSGLEGKHLVENIIDASGQTTHLNYNSYGQLTEIRNPKNETTTLHYLSSGFQDYVLLPPVAGSGLTDAQRTITFTPDTFLRVGAIADPEGYTVQFAYDALDRITLITYPGSPATTEQIIYDKLDAVLTKDRLSRWTYYGYDRLGRLALIREPDGRTAKLDWCSCESLGTLVDPLGQLTVWERDLQGRVTRKIYADETTASYTYEPTTSRLRSVTDAKSQVTHLAYYLDNKLRSVTYTGSAVPTPGVGFEYDPVYDRVAAMLDGTGRTRFEYNPVPTSPPGTPTTGAGRLLFINTPLGGNNFVDTTFAYDELGRVVTRSMSGSTLTMHYDELGRPKAVNNALGDFAYAYVR